MPKVSKFVFGKYCMNSFKDFIKDQRQKKGLSQTEFGQPLNIIMTDISKIENGKKKFPFHKLESLAKLLEIDYNELKNIYVADKLVEEARKYDCSDEVFCVAESQSKYYKNPKINNVKV